MYCTRCGVEQREDDRFCSRCGAKTGVARAENAAKPLMLDKRNKKIGGVCAGLARYFEVDVVLMRVLVLAVALATGVGFLAYLAAWMIMPSDHSMQPNAVFTPGAQTS